jgi:DnaJ-class molecular chaperone
VDFEDILGGMFSGRGRQGRGNFATKGSDVQARLEIELEEAIKGAVKRVVFADGRTLDITIPKGAADGQTLRLRGQGHPGRGGAASGDALIELSLRPHPIFRREEADLHMDLPVSVPDAVLGAKVDAPTPDGPVALTVPRHAQAGAVLRLKGRGAVDAETGRRGDLFAHIVIALPETIDPELERFAETWRRERPYSPPRARPIRRVPTPRRRPARSMGDGPIRRPILRPQALAPAMAQPTAPASAATGARSRTRCGARCAMAATCP